MAKTDADEAASPPGRSYAEDRGVDATIWPLMSTSAPPGISRVDCGVGLNEILNCFDRPCERPSALTVPRVTVKFKPNGFPKAMTVSPTCRVDESPRTQSASSCVNFHDRNVSIRVGADYFGLEHLLSLSMISTRWHDQ